MQTKSKVINSLLTVRQQFHTFTNINEHNPINIYGKLWSAVLSGSSCTADRMSSGKIKSGQHIKLEQRLQNRLRSCLYMHTCFWWCVLSQTCWDMSLNKANTIPKEAHLGVSARPWGLTLSYEHHLCQSQEWSDIKWGGVEHNSLNLGDIY